MYFIENISISAL